MTPIHGAQPIALLRFKMTPPAPGLAVLRRGRLVDRLKESLAHPERRGTAIIAGAGYGKTTLLAGFLQEAGVDSVWYSLDPSDRDPILFFRYLIEVIRQRCDEFGRLAEELLEDGTTLSTGPEGIDRFVDVLINDARETLASRVCLILDDAHHLEGGEAVLRGVRRLLTDLPDALHIVLTSRTVPDIGVPSLKAKDRLSVIDQGDLTFSREETSDLLLRIFGLSVDAARVADLHAQAQGWVTALQLLRQQAMTRAGAEIQTDDALLARTREEVFDYFGDDVYVGESEQVRAFLRRSSLPSILDTGILSVVLDDLPVPGIVESLLRRNLFLLPLAGRMEAHTYHPLFREFLARKLREEEGENAVDLLHERYGRAFQEREDHAAALRHFGMARSVPQLASLLIREGPSLVRHGMLETVKSAFASLGDSEEPDPRLTLLRAEMQRIEGDYTGALRSFDRGLSAATGLSGTERAGALQGKAYAAMKLGSLPHSEELAKEALALAGDEDPALSARILNTLAIVEYRLGRYDDAIRGWKEALDLARRAGDRAMLRRVAHNLGLPHGTRGEYDKALDYFRMLLQMEEEQEAPLGPEYATAALNVARIEILRGAMQDAAGHLDDALEISRKFDLKALRGDVLEAQGNLLRETGDADGARARYAAARTVFTELGFDDLRDDVDEEEARLLLRIGAEDEALRRADDLLARCEEDAVPAVRRAAALQLAGEARLAMVRRDGGADGDRAGALGEGARMLEEARGLYHAGKLRFQEAESGLLLARTRLALGDEEAARSAAHDALKLVARFGYGHMARRSAAPCAGDANSRRGAQGSFADLLATFPEWEAIGGAAPALDATSESVGGALGGHDLTIHMLGPVEVYRDERRQIPATAWTLRKALRILCYLAAARERRATKDRIADTFWQDAPLDVIEKNFHPTISYLRKALNMSHAVRKNFILFEKGAYRLNPQYRYRIDLVEFEEAIRAARAARRSDPEEALRHYDRARTLHRGEFLEEEYEDWAEAPREHYAGLMTACLEEAGALHAAAGRWQQALELYEGLVKRDPLSEPASCRVMTALAAMGDRARVAQEYQRLVRALKDELGLEPLPETRSVYETGVDRR